MTYEITFEQRQGNANYGKIVLVATREGGDDATVNVYIDLTDPSGSAVNTHNFATPDLAVTTPGTKTWTIPTDANGDSLRGTYSLKIWEEQTVSDPDVQVKTQDESYYFKAYSNKASLSWSEICVPGVVGILTLVDEGDYSDLVETNRELKIVFPPEEGLADLTGSGTSLTINPHWTGVSYIGSVSAEYYTQNDDSVPVEWFEQYKFSGQLVKEFNCSSCEITDCIQEYAVKLAAKTSLSQSDKDTMDRLSIYEIAYRSAKNCGNLADAAAWVTKIKALLDCDCGCGETSSGAAPFETAIFDDLLATAIADSVTTTDWVQVETFSNSWQSNGDFDAGNALRWRRIGDNHIELTGDIQKNGGLSAGVGSVFMTASEFGVDLLPFHFNPVNMTQNSGAPVNVFGGNMAVDGSGNLTIYPATSVTPSGVAGFSFHVFLPIVL